MTDEEIIKQRIRKAIGSTVTLPVAEVDQIIKNKERAEELLQGEVKARTAARDNDREDGFEALAQAHQEKIDELNAFLGWRND